MLVAKAASHGFIPSTVYQQNPHSQWCAVNVEHNIVNKFDKSIITINIVPQRLALNK